MYHKFCRITDDLNYSVTTAKIGLHVCDIFINLFITTISSIVNTIFLLKSKNKNQLYNQFNNMNYEEELFSCNNLMECLEYLSIEKFHEQKYELFYTVDE